jgi:hypothetical protein
MENWQLYYIWGNEFEPSLSRSLPHPTSGHIHKESFITYFLKIKEQIRQDSILAGNSIMKSLILEYAIIKQNPEERHMLKVFRFMSRNRILIVKDTNHCGWNNDAKHVCHRLGKPQGRIIRHLLGFDFDWYGFSLFRIFHNNLRYIHGESFGSFWCDRTARQADI